MVCWRAFPDPRSFLLTAVGLFDGCGLRQDLTSYGLSLANPIGRLRGDLFDHVHPFDDSAEGRESPGIRLGSAIDIKHGGVPGADEELRDPVAACEEIAGQGHRPV